ncbi:MAG: tetratricopeptide repeat protein [Solirubrobacterales bacterium]
MWHWRRSGRVNVQFVLVLIFLAVGVGVALFTVRRLNANSESTQARNEGDAAYANENWRAARERYREYLNHNPADLPALHKYAQVCLSIRPLDVTAVNEATSSYRRILELDPGDKFAGEGLALIYGKVENFSDLASLARARLSRDPNDRAAPLWLADALDNLGRPGEARQVLQSLIGRLDALGEKGPEYARAIIHLSQLVDRETAAQPRIATDGADANNPSRLTGLDWLDHGVEHAPDSIEVLVSRAQFFCRMAEMSRPDEGDRQSLLIKARRDLEDADAQRTDDARLLLMVGAAWLAQGEVDRAAAKLEALDRLTPEKIARSFPETGDWIAARFVFALELAVRSQRTAETISLVDGVLTAPLEKGQKIRVLSSAIRVYVGAGRIADARRCLDEYLALLGDQQSAAGLLPHVTWLKALVAEAENQPYEVINLVEPLVAKDVASPALWRLLAESYKRTGQAGRVAGALEQYIRLNPEDAQAVGELARQYSKAGNWQKTLETASVAVSLGAADLPLALLRIEAEIHIAARQRADQRVERLRKPSADLAELRQAQPDQVDIRILQAGVAEILGQTQSAENELKLAIVECKEPLRARMQLADFYLRSGRVKEAADICQAACRSDGAISEPWLALAEVYTTQADYDSACRCLTTGLDGIAEASERRSMSIRLAMVELLRGDRKSAMDRLKALMSEDPGDIQARSLLLDIREVQEDSQFSQRLVDELRGAEGQAGLWWRFRQASLWLSRSDWASKEREIAELLQHCIQADPTWSAPVLLLADLYEKSGNYGRLEEVCQQGLLANPSSLDVADRLLTLLERQGRFVDIQKLLQRVDLNRRFVDDWKIRGLWGAQDVTRVIDELKLRVLGDPQDSRSRVNLAWLVYQHSRDAGQAMEYLRQAESIDPHSPMLVGLKASILRNEGKSEESLHILGDYVAAHDEFNAYWIRGAYLAEDGRLDLAEQDYKRLIGFAANAVFGYELLGNFYAATKRLDEGVAALEQGLTVYADDVRLSRRLMQLLLLRAGPGDHRKAMLLLNKLEESQPQDVELLILRAQQMLREPSSQSFDAVTKKLENAIHLVPGAVDAHLALIAISMQQANYQAACNYAVQALVSNPGNPSLLAARARAEQALGYPETAVKFAREALRTDPNSQGALDVLVQTALVSGNRKALDEVRVLVEASLDRNPNNDGLLVSYAHVMTALKMPEAAVPRLEACCRNGKSSGSIACCVTLVDLCLRSGDAKQALTWIEQAERLNAKSQAVVHARFLWLLSQKRFTELAQISSMYKSADEQNLFTVLDAASELLMLDVADLKREAVSLFEHAVSQWPQSLDARLGLASSLYQTGNIDGAKEVYQQLLKGHPDNIRILNDYAWLLQEHGERYTDALELVNRALRLVTDDGERVYLLDTRGAILTKMPDRLAEARRDYEEILRLSTCDARHHAKALLQLVRICVRVEDAGQAQEYLNRLQELDRKTQILVPDERKEISGMIRA